MRLAGHPFQVLDADDDNFLKLERMIVSLYDRTSSLSSVNETRRELFCHKNRAMDKLPSTKDSLLKIPDGHCIKQESGPPAHKHS